MKLSAWLPLLAIQGAACAQQAVPEPPSEALSPALASAQASVVLVQSRIGGGHIYQGSGVVVAPGLVATNAHVTRGTQGHSVQQGLTSWPVVRVRQDLPHDLCLLYVPGLSVPAARVAPEPTQPGQPVMAVGYPGGRLAVAHGYLRGIWHHGDGRLLQSDALTLPGNSGGGLFDAEGRLLGLTTLTFTPSPRLNFSVPVAWIQALAAEPEGLAEARPAGSLANRGSELLERLSQDPRNWPAWESAARQWVRDLPEDGNAWLALGLARDRAARTAAETGQGQNPAISGAALEEGIAAYRRALSFRQDAKTWNNLGVALDLQNQFEAAEQAFQEALRLEPDYTLAWMNLGSARMNARRFAEAEVALQRGLSLQADDGDAWMRLAHCQRLAGHGAAAVETFRVALRYRPLNADLWLDLGLLLAGLARREEARQVQVRLEEMNPEGAARLQAAISRIRSGRSPAAAGAGKRSR